MLDLPNHSVLVGGLEHWRGTGEELNEPRLVEKLKRLLELPASSCARRRRTTTIPPRRPRPALRFGNSRNRSRRTVEESVEGGGAAVPSRSSEVAARAGQVPQRAKQASSGRPDPFRPGVPTRTHLGDVDWYYFAHRAAAKCRRPLHIDERGTTGDIAETWIRCECGERRRLSDAASLQLKALGRCDGARPWLGPFTREECDEPNRLLVRHASNAYFPQVMSVISLPDRAETLEKAVNQVWADVLEFVESLDELQREQTAGPR